MVGAAGIEPAPSTKEIRCGYLVIGGYESSQTSTPNGIIAMND